MHLEVYTDGSATTNDKPGGYGYVIVIDGKKYSEGSGHIPKASNNDAELEAAIQGLKTAQSILEVTPQEYITNIRSENPIKNTVSLVSDSQLILGWANDTYAFRQTDKLHKFQELRLYVFNLNVQTRWVEGHSGNEHNERCDVLANEARLSVQKAIDKVEAIKEGESLIGTKKNGVVCIWYKNCLKVINLDDNIVEDYEREIHGTRGSLLEIREEKSR